MRVAARYTGKFKVPVDVNVRFPVLFTAFLLGLLTGSPAQRPESLWPDLGFLAAILVAFLPLRKYPWALFTLACVAAFQVGNLWITQLPTWPEPLKVEGLPFDAGCTVVGRATGDAFECARGRFLPLDLELVRAEGFDRTGAAFQGKWKPERGTVLAVVRRDFVGVPGARYQVHGKLDCDSGELHSPILLRYRARAVIAPPSTGVSLDRMSDPSPTRSAVNSFRYLLISHLSWGLEKPEDELVAGITFGRKGRRLGGEWAKDFYRAGLSHLIVASGAQVSLLFLPVFFLLGRVRMPQPVKWALLVLLGTMLIGFAQLLGGEPSILRAAVMGCVLLIAVGIGRRAYGLATLSAAGLFWLIDNPLLARDTGFLLSFAASFGIVYLGPPMFEAFSSREPLPKPRLKRGAPLTSLVDAALFHFRAFLRLLTDWTLVTMSAQIGVLPVLACTVGRVSISGFVANLFAVPIAQVILFLGALSGLAGFASPAVSMFLNKILGHLATALMTVAHDFANVPNASVTIEPLPGWTALLWFGICVVVVELRRVLSQRSPKRSPTRDRRDMKTDP